MTSISQYVERRPSDSNCLMQHTMAVASVTPPSGRRSLPDMSGPPPAPPPPSMATTVSVAPRKSALKHGSSNTKLVEGGGQMVTSTFRAHLPPPEFADTSPPGGSVVRQQHFTLAEVTPHSSFRTLPRQQINHMSAGAPTGVGMTGAVSESQNTQTLPLKSNLKKSGSGNTTSGSGAKNSLQWSSDHHTGTSSTNRQVSMEELRV